MRPGFLNVSIRLALIILLAGVFGSSAYNVSAAPLVGKTDEPVLFETTPGASAPVPLAVSPATSTAYLRQFFAGASLADILEGQTINKSAVVFGAIVVPGPALPHRLEVEVRPIGEPFTGTPNLVGAFVPYDWQMDAYVATSSLPDAAYHWQGRAADTGGGVTPWQEFGAPGNIDFIVSFVPEPGILVKQELVPKHSSSTIVCSNCSNMVAATQVFRPNVFGTLAAIRVTSWNSTSSTGLADCHLRLFDDESGALIAVSESVFSGYGCESPEFSFASALPQLKKDHRYRWEFYWGTVQGFVSLEFWGYEQNLVGGTFAMPPNPGTPIVNAGFVALRGPDQRVPVIIVPGIMGTRLNRVSDGEEVWPDILKMSNLLTPSDSYLDELKLDTSGHEISGQDMNPSAVIEEVGPKDYFGPLLDELINVGYVASSTLFTFPYDWRLDVRDEVGRLDNLVNQVRAVSPNGKVNVIAHSLGSLLLKEYLRQATSTSFLEKVILVGAPQLGAPKAFKALNYGDNMGFEVGPVDILNPERVKIISQNMPGIYELLPSRRYVAINGGYVEDFRGVGPKRPLTYNETTAFMQSTNASSNLALASSSDQFHGNLDEISFSAPHVYNIVGCQNSETIGKLRVYDGGDVDITTVDGDGTVPLVSAMNLISGYQNYFVRGDLTGANHRGLVSDGEPVALIRNIIEGTSILPFGVSTSTAFCFPPPEEFVNETTIAVSTHSPVALHVYDSQGRHTGPLSNGDLELGIPSSTYMRISENNFAFVPANNIYRFVADGLDSGFFNLKVKGYRGSNLSQIITYLNVPLSSASTTGQVQFTSIQSPPNLELDNDGDGIFEVAVSPSAVLNSISSADVAPPITTIIPTGTFISEGWYVTPVQISFTSTDDLSGTFKTYYSLDGTTFTPYTAPFTISNEGTTRVWYYSMDKAGNNEGIKTKDITINTSCVPVYPPKWMKRGAVACM